MSTYADIIIRHVGAFFALPPKQRGTEYPWIAARDRSQAEAIRVLFYQTRNRSGLREAWADIVPRVKLEVEPGQWVLAEKKGPFPKDARFRVYFEDRLGDLGTLELGFGQDPTSTLGSAMDELHEEEATTKRSQGLSLHTTKETGHGPD